MKVLISPPVSPLFLPTTSLIVGIILSHYQTPVTLIFSITALFALGVTLFKRVTYPFYSITTVCFVWGYAWTYYQTTRPLLPPLKDLIGVVYQLKDNTAYLASHKTEGAIRCYLPRNHCVSLGEQINIAKAYFIAADLDKDKRDGVAAYAYIAHLDVLPALHSSPIMHVHTRLNATLSTLEKSWQHKLSAITLPLFSTLFLGASLNQEQKETRNQFSTWGISHYLARSGLHVAIMLIIWRLLLRLLRIKYIVQLFLLGVLLLIYTAFSYSSISFSRAILASILAGIYQIALARTNPSHIVILTCFLTLAYNPFHLFFINFQLSFLLAFVIAWFYEITRKA